MDLTHLHVIELRLSRERARLALDPTNELRRVLVAQIEKELASERTFLGLSPEEPQPDLSDDELLAALGL